MMLKMLSIISIFGVLLISGCTTQAIESPSPQFSYCLGNDVVFNRDALQIGCQDNVCTITFAEGIKPIITTTTGISMYPTMCNKDITILVPVNEPENLHIGDIIATETGTMHRIINACEGGWVLKGDYWLAVPDGCIPYSRIRERLVVQVRK